MRMRCCTCAFIKFECGTIAMNLCIYFLEHALFLKQSGSLKFCLGFFSYKLYLSCQWPKNAYILSHNLHKNIVNQTFQIDLDCCALNASL